MQKTGLPPSRHMNVNNMKIGYIPKNYSKTIIYGLRMLEYSDECKEIIPDIFYKYLENLFVTSPTV